MLLSRCYAANFAHKQAFLSSIREYALPCKHDSLIQNNSEPYSQNRLLQGFAFAHIWLLAKEIFKKALSHASMSHAFLKIALALNCYLHYKSVCISLQDHGQYICQRLHCIFCFCECIGLGTHFNQHGFGY